MNEYVSTRGSGPVRLGQALFQGLAPDGGLYVPTELPRFPEPPGEVPDLAAAARWVGPSLLGIAEDVVARIATEVLTFRAPLVEVDPGVHVMELFHGPTHAFKDIAAQFMARLMSELDEGAAMRTVLVATSGDTGGAVAHAFRGLPGYRVVVMFPDDGISPRQRRQMTTLGDNVRAVAVEGTFDDCQRLAKEAFRDDALRAAHHLTSANSINIGRLLPQTFYYVLAASSLGWAETPALFVAPSGNLGNLSGGLLAARCGMPRLGFVSAVNANRGFADFLATGSFEPRASVRTHSNAMDVGDPSNLERIRWLYRDDPSRLGSDVTGVSVDDAETADTIRAVFERTGYVLDPHTAVAFRALERLGGTDRGPAVVLATAHPAKFPDVVEEVIGRPVSLPPGITAVLDAEEHMMEITADLTALRTVLEAD